MKTSTTRPAFASRLFDALTRRRRTVLAGLAIVVAAGVVGATRMKIDMSFRPTFIGDQRELRSTAAHERIFGQVGFRDLVAMVDVGDASDPRALEQVAGLAERLRRMPEVIEVRDPLTFPFFDRHGAIQPRGITGALPPGASLDSNVARPLIEDLLRSPSARRLVVADDRHGLAVTASIDIPNEQFHRRRAAVTAFRRVVADWSRETGHAVRITGYPEVEQVYASEVLTSVFRSIGALLAMMLVILIVYFRRWTDVLTCLAGVTLSVPLVLGLMTVLGQPFSIVNSQVLTLVLIVGIGQALHHQEEYRRRREAGREHLAANREAFAILAWPSLMTGFATSAGFAALVTADMRAIWSFGLSTALGVVVVYVVNWLVVPSLIDRFYRSAGPATFLPRASWTLSIVRAADRLLRGWPKSVVGAFVAVTIALTAAGATKLSVDQRVNEELPAGHPALVAETTYEQQYAGFLGPELSIVPRGGDVGAVGSELAAFVNRLCDMPEVRYVGSPLDLLPQAALPADHHGKACHREAGDLTLASMARSGLVGPEVERLASSVISSTGDRAAVIVRVADIGTARSLPFVERIRAAARETMPHADVQPVGQWWLAQQGMDRLSMDVMLSAITALLVILPIMWLGIRDLRLFLAAIPPTIVPVVATLGFMGLAHITVRIGTAMIMAIALGLAADDTVHLSVRIRDRVLSGSNEASAVSATLLRTGRPCSFSSYVLIGGFGSMLASSLLALRAMGAIAIFTMVFALATDVVLGPALYLLLPKRRPSTRPRPETPSVRQMLDELVERHPERPALSYRTSGPASPWHTLTWHEACHLVLETSARLDALAPARGTVAVLADTDARYPLLELAVVLTGRVFQPLYVTSEDDELARALGTTRADVLIVGHSQLARAHGGRLHARVVVLESIVPLPGVADAPLAVLPADVEPFDTSIVRARLAGLPSRRPGDPLLYLQSTGTTGPARVIEVSERAIVEAVEAVRGEASHRFPRLLSFLPTAHISERLLTLYASLALGGHVFHGGGLETMAEDLRACRPSIFLAPPLLLSIVRTKVRAAAEASALGRWLLASVQTTAEAALASGVMGGAKKTFGARLFGHQLRRELGLGSVRDALVGTAPITSDLHAWYEAVGLPFRVVYGQTEVAGATSIARRTGARFGAVGLPVTGADVRIGAGDELLVRAPSMFSAYVGDAVATARVKEGAWMHTGDRARLLPTGEIELLGRVQSIKVAADGAMVDTEGLATEVRTVLGAADVVFVGSPAAGGASLFVTLPSPLPGSGSPAPLPATDPRCRALVELLETADPHGVVRAWALFLGAFEQATGEVGPTGKPRGWRIAELRTTALTPIVRSPGRPAPSISRSAAASA
jgi:predicted RND superfamily exporter protein/long-subunit acyl-CoA synthetase (AMP-forming)